MAGTESCKPFNGDFPGFKVQLIADMFVVQIDIFLQKIIFFHYYWQVAACTRNVAASF